MHAKSRVTGSYRWDRTRHLSERHVSRREQTPAALMLHLVLSSFIFLQLVLVYLRSWIMILPIHLSVTVTLGWQEG